MVQALTPIQLTQFFSHRQNYGRLILQWTLPSHINRWCLWYRRLTARSH